MRWHVVAALAVAAFSVVAVADGPQDNLPDKVRPVPPPGVKIAEADRAELEKGVAELGKEIDDLRVALRGKAGQLELLPDIQVFHNAVRYALKYDEFFNLKEVPVARNLLKVGLERARQLRDGKPAWVHATGLVVRGYVSRIDGSVQPYGLVVPNTYQSDSPHKFRLDFWCHGRGETLSELSFVDQRMKNRGEFTPPNAFVVHLYGRYCNANKFAGEVDLFEAYEHIRKHYPIDENRLVIRGFSMGGAACWQFATHYPGMWAAAAPGAGFSETPEFLDVFQKEKLQPTWYEKKLWGLYNCTDYAINLFNCPTVAYSGEDDKQKQAADVMARELAKQGITLTHIIGPKTGHKYHPDAKVEINRLIDSIVARGRDPVPERVVFTTRTLRYNRCLWVALDGISEHWEEALIDASILSGTGIKSAPRKFVRVAATNVTAFTLDFPAGYAPWSVTEAPSVSVNGKAVAALPRVATDRSWKVSIRKDGDGWKVVPQASAEGLAKIPGLQGPIDDAFFDRFVMVQPTGQPMNDKVGKWASAEMKHAVVHWRKQFRGEAIVKDDKEITDADIASSNLVLWGDPSSNAVLARIADKLPIRWTAKGVEVGGKTFSADNHVPVLVFPNPLNPKKYVVLNSGFTFREYDYLNNARQVPRLPDWAVVDVSSPVTSRSPGGIVAADFFDEAWKLRAAR